MKRLIIISALALSAFCNLAAADNEATCVQKIEVSRKVKAVGSCKCIENCGALERLDLTLTQHYKLNWIEEVISQEVVSGSVVTLPAQEERKTSGVTQFSSTPNGIELDSNSCDSLKESLQMQLDAEKQ